ncbi:MAG: GNAT family N-acetyltransferase [bacterium]
MRLTEKVAIAAFLETDRFYAGYALGDLEPGLYEQCDWFGDGGGGALNAIALVFRGFAPPVLFLMGDSDGLGRILPRAGLPKEVYLNCREQHLQAAGSLYAWDRLAAMWRMALDAQNFKPAGSGCVRLEQAQSRDLAALYALGGGPAFKPAQMERGIFYGAFADGRLVAAAGTHVVSYAHGIAAVGNVFTASDYRKRGLGAASTSAVVADLVSRGIRDVILNVEQSNEAALRLYERLGFRRHCPFLEGRATATQGRGLCC